MIEVLAMTGVLAEGVADLARALVVIETLRAR